jgi:hypothetical protein
MLHLLAQSLYRLEFEAQVVFFFHVAENDGLVCIVVFLSGFLSFWNCFFCGSFFCGSIIVGFFLEKGIFVFERFFLFLEGLLFRIGIFFDFFDGFSF